MITNKLKSRSGKRSLVLHHLSAFKGTATIKQGRFKTTQLLRPMFLVVGELKGRVYDIYDIIKKLRFQEFSGGQPQSNAQARKN